MGFVTKMLSDEKGQPSSQRVCMLLLIVAVIVWISCAGYAGRKLPDIPGSLADFIQWLFSVLVFGVAAAKGTTAYVLGKGGNPCQPPQ